VGERKNIWKGQWRRGGGVWRDGGKERGMEGGRKGPGKRDGEREGGWMKDRLIEGCMTKWRKGKRGGEREGGGTQAGREGQMDGWRERELVSGWDGWMKTRELAKEGWRKGRRNG